MLGKIKTFNKKIVSDELVRGSIVLFVMINIFNVLNYMFHFSMARLLGPADYGILAVLFSFIYIFSIPTEAIQNVITNYTSKLTYKNEGGKIKFLLLKSLSKGVLASLVIFLLFIPFSFFIAGIIKIDFILLAYTGTLIFFFVCTPIARGVLQGRKKFFSLGLNMIAESSFKLVLGVLIVLAGFKIYGAITAVIIAVALSFLLVFVSLRDILKEDKKAEKFSDIYSYSIPYFVATLAVVLIYSLDVILAKVFFTPDLAGKYSVASMLGKMIFFGTMAVGKTMFPIASQNHEAGKNSFYLLKKSLKILGVIAFIVLSFYYFFPELVIGILFGKQYLEMSGVLFIIGLALTMLSFSNLLILYGLVTSKIKKSSFTLLVFFIAEIVLLSLFHSSLLEFSIVFLMINFLMLVYSIILTIK
jgi:O-antigen/teichoic acid export membrane protein